MNPITLITNFFSYYSGHLYTFVLVAVLCGVGLFFTLRTRGAQITSLPDQLRAVSEPPKNKKGVSSFQSLMVSTASRVGTGNIIGVSSALCLGGVGAVFWMWVIAVIGGATAFIESTLGQIYKRRGKNGSYGGPAQYIEQGLGSRTLAVIFSVFMILTYAVGFNMLASFNLQSSFSGYTAIYNEKITPWIIGGVTAILVAICLFGGGKSILKVTGVLVPVMGVTYILVALLAVLLNFSAFGAMIESIFRDAFNFRAIFGGFGGSCLMYGIKRGLFSNEAGVGSAPNAAASADVSHPVKQGLVQTLSVFIDTILICSATAFMCLSSGVVPTAAMEGAPYVQEALRATFGAAGPIFITVSMALFAFTTLVGNIYYADQAWKHIFKKEPPRAFMIGYYAVAVLLVFVGAGLNAGLLWSIADILMGVLVLINLPTIIILSKYPLRALADFQRKRREGKELSFRAADVGLTQPLDYWQGEEDAQDKSTEENEE